MTSKRDFIRLQEITDLVRDHRLGQMRSAAAKRAQSLQQIEALDRPDDGTDQASIVGNLVALRYQTWADRRRAELNVVLARQTVDWIDAVDSARKAFGQTQALRALRDRIERKS